MYCKTVPLAADLVVYECISPLYYLNFDFTHKVHIDSLLIQHIGDIGNSVPGAFLIKGNIA